MMTVKIARVKTGMRKHWEIQGSQLHWRWFVDVDYFIAINVHTQPLDLQCRWRLVQKRVSQSLVDKRGKAMLNSCLKKNQLVGSSEVPTSLHQCSGSPAAG